MLDKSSHDRKGPERCVKMFCEAAKVGQSWVYSCRNYDASNNADCAECSRLDGSPDPRGHAARNGWAAEPCRTTSSRKGDAARAASIAAAALPGSAAAAAAADAARTLADEEHMASHAERRSFSMAAMSPGWATAPQQPGGNWTTVPQPAPASSR